MKINQEHSNDRSGGELLQLVTFKLGNEEFGLDILRVQEIIRMAKITKVPNAPRFVEGVINLRGKVIPVINLRSRLSLENLECSSKTRIIVIDSGSLTVGFIVDEVDEVLRIGKDTMEETPKMVASVDSDFITNVAKLENRLLILLDIERLIAMDKEQIAA